MVPKLWYSILRFRFYDHHRHHHHHCCPCHLCNATVKSRERWGGPIKDLSMMYRTMWDRRNEGATRISHRMHWHIRMAHLIIIIMLETIEHIKHLSDIFCQVCVWYEVFSHHDLLVIHDGMCYQLIHFFSDIHENSFSSFNRRYDNHQPLFRVSSWNNGKWCMFCYVLGM